MMKGLEGTLTRNQYAYRRDRGTEHHLEELTDFAREQNRQRKFAYVASIDVAGVFDAAPHIQLMKTAEALGVDGFTCRYIAKWLAGRVFSARLRTPSSSHFRTWRRLSRGLPQGGVLSPFLWLLHFNPPAESLLSKRAERVGPTRDVDFRIYIYADDVTCALAHKNEPTLTRAAWETSEDVMQGLQVLGLSSAGEKAENLPQILRATFTAVPRRIPASTNMA